MTNNELAALAEFFGAVKKGCVNMTWEELEKMTAEYPNIVLVYKGKDRIGGHGNDRRRLV